LTTVADILAASELPRREVVAARLGGLVAAVASFSLSTDRTLARAHLVGQYRHIYRVSVDGWAACSPGNLRREPFLILAAECLKMIEAIAGADGRDEVRRETPMDAWQALADYVAAAE